MSRSLMSRLAHAHHPIAAPLDDESVRRLLARAVVRGDERLLDLGCGQAEWLVRALVEYPQATAVGGDVSAEALAEARKQADLRGVGERLVLHEQDAGAFTSERGFDVVVSVGATHAFGGLMGALATARKHLAPGTPGTPGAPSAPSASRASGGRVLVGDAYWAAEPSDEARQMLGDYEDLASTVDRVVAGGWTPVFGHISSRQELDDYEWHWTGALAGWALDHPDDARSQEALATADRHRSEWLHGYRGCFGFLALVLRTGGGSGTTVSRVGSFG